MIRRPGLLAAALAVVALCACPRPPPLPPPPTAPSSGLSAAERQAQRDAAEALLERIRAAHQKPLTVSGDAKAFVDAAENGGRYALMFAVQRPDSLRIDALMPWGEPAASLVTSGGRMAFLDDRNKKFYRGASTPRNLSLLLPAPLADTELVALLSGALPELPGGEPSLVEEAGEGKERLILRQVPAGLRSLRGLTQVAVVAPDLTVLEVSRFVEGGDKPVLEWQAVLEEQGKAGAENLPALIHVHIPAASVGQSRDVELDLRLKNLSAGHPPPQQAFALAPPAGMQIVDLDREK